MQITSPTLHEFIPYIQLVTMLVTLIIVWVKLDNAISAANKLFSELREQVEENTKDISKLDKRVVRVETFCQAQHHFHMGETPKEVEG